jgi:PPOX class probable F420-dependent enzyme
MTAAERDEFLAVPRLGMLTTLREDGAPVTVPVWFEWDGVAVRVFSGADSGKVKRIKRDPRASLTVPNVMGEPEAWVAFDGRAAISSEGAIELSERLAHRYWDMGDAGHKKTLGEWRASAAYLRVVELKPESVRTSKG